MTINNSRSIPDSQLMFACRILSYWDNINSLFPKAKKLLQKKELGGKKGKNRKRK